MEPSPVVSRAWAREMHICATPVIQQARAVVFVSTWPAPHAMIAASVNRVGSRVSGLNASYAIRLRERVPTRDDRRNQCQRPQDGADFIGAFARVSNTESFASPRYK